MADEGERWHVDVLGPVRVRDATGQDVTPDGVLQRRLLALLVLRRDRVVTVDQAVDALWPAAPPRNPAAALQNQVFRLRRRLPEGLVESAGAGYRLASSAIVVDVDRLTDLLAGEPAPGTIEALDDVLAGWRGPAYEDLADVDEARVEAARLDELRIRAIERRAESRLAVGDTDGLVAELVALVDDQPLRERPRALLIDALARADRRAEALRAYDDFRRLLGDELGIEPSPALVAQHAALLADDEPTPLTALANRLPVPATSLVGRDELVTEVSSMVERHRLVTLVGPGGVGKTRLAVEVGHRARSTRPERTVVMSELATATVDSALDVVAAAVGIDTRPGADPVERITTVLGDRDVLVVLDNCEHVLEPIAELADRLLTTTPAVTVLATSRERLRVNGEHVRAVPTLPADAADGTGPAVELFLQRARAVAPTFAPGRDELAAVAEIVRRLDGLPLAIELAAARLHTHDVAEVVAGLDARFALLSSGPRTSTRHGSLSAVVQWSYGLLDETLRRLFPDLSVFAGSFTVADAAAVGDVPTPVAAASLTQLTERSLVMRAAGGRYVLLETLRAFGAEQLDRDGRSAAVRDRHARRQIEWIEDADRRMSTAGQGVIAEIDAAIPELRAALGWLLEQGDAERAGHLLLPVFDYAFLRQRPDVLAWAHRVLAADPDERSPVAPLVRAAAAYAAWMVGDVAATDAHSRRALAIAERAGVPVPPLVATICGSQQLFEGRLDEAVGWYRRAAELAATDPIRQLFARSTELLALGYADDPAATALADEVLAEVGDVVTPHAAYVWYCAGEALLGRDVATARSRLAEAVRLAELTDASIVVGLAGASLASIDARLGDPTAAAEAYRRLIAHWRRAGVWSTQWTMLRSVAVLLARLGRPREAAVLEGAVRATAAGHRIFGADEAALDELAEQLRAALGEDAYRAAVAEGALLDGDAAVEHALRSL